MDTTSQTSSPQASGSTAVARQSYPISFNLHDRDLQHVLYILDDPAGQHLTLDLTNTSGRDIILEKNGSSASKTNHHFELRFRPGTLPPASLNGIALTSPGWSLGHSSTPSGHGPVSLFFLSSEDRTLETGEKLTLELEHVNTDGRGGSRGTNVELRCKDLWYTVKPPEAVPSAPRLEHLSIINHRGQKHIPLHVGFVGSNTILNDGSTPNELSLRITNASKENITLGSTSDRAPTIFTFSFDVQAEGESKDWALGTASQIQGIEFKGKDTRVGGKQWKIAQLPGESPEWTLSLLAEEQRTVLAAGEVMEFTCTNIITGLPTGHANLYVRYENIPGYWDGQFVCVIEKGALVLGTSKPGADKEKFEGHVGIGTTEPKSSLELCKKVPSGIGPVLTLNNETGGKGTGAAIDFNSYDVKSGAPAASIRFADAGDWSSSLTLHTKEPGDAKNQLVERLRIASNGRVGIGTDKPEAKLHVTGNSRFEGVQVEGSFRCGELFVSRLVDKASSEENVKILNGSEVSNVWPDPPNRKFKPTILVGDEIRINDQIRTVTHIGESFLTLGAPFPKEYTKGTMTVLGEGNVGIGTTSPRSKLAVADGVAIGFAYANEQTAPTNGLLVEGRIGIGTPSPQAVLEVAGSQPPAAGANAPPVLRVTGGKGGNNTSGKGGAGASISIRAGDGGDALPGQTGGRGGSVSVQSGHVGAGTDFKMEGHGFANITLQPAGGGVVIGNIGTNPSRGLLEVVGHVYAQGLNGSAKDLAENYFSDSELAPGDVVCLDRNNDKIILSRQPDDLLVAGVISTEPGFLLNAKNDDDQRNDDLFAYPVALRGRVPCKVIDENGSIKRGDLLTTSSTTGHAMKASPVNVGGIEIYRPGTIIGKALASHESGKGVIEVLITGS